MREMREKILQLRAEGKKYREICEILGCSWSLICYYCGDNHKEKRREYCRKRQEQGYQRPPRKNNLYCQYCQSALNATKKKYCNSSCQSQYIYEQKIKLWKEGLIVGYTGQTCQVSKWVRKYLFQKHNSKCCKCGWGEINQFSNLIPLEVHHIDGNPKHCHEDNLELICLRCHSLTPNFRSLNKNSPRKRK